MKNRYTPLLLSLISINASAQVVFDVPGAIPPMGTTNRELWLDLSGVPALVTSGQGITWDLSTLLLFNPAVQSTLTDPATTPFAADFPGSTHAVGLDEDGSGPVWTYYTLANDSLFVDGGEWPPTLFTCPDPRLAAVFPFVYGQLASDSAVCQYPGGPPAGSTDGYELVASGTIVYPGGTINDVAMLRHWFNGVALDDYYWYTTDNILSSVGRYALTDDLLVLHPSSSQNTVAESAMGLRLRAYPVPAAAAVCVEVPGLNGWLSYELFDASGRTLESDMLNAQGGRIHLDISGLPSGHYVLRIVGESTSMFARLSVAR